MAVEVRVNTQGEVGWREDFRSVSLSVEMLKSCHTGDDTKTAQSKDWEPRRGILMTPHLECRQKI